MGDKRSAFLLHYGVPGMRWGVQRSRQISSTSGLPTRKKYPLDAAQEHVSAREAVAKGRHKLSNKELKDTIERLNLEQQYDRLSPSGKAKAAKVTSKVLGRVGDTVLNTIIGTTVKVAANVALDKIGFDSKGKKK